MNKMKNRRYIFRLLGVVSILLHAGACAKLDNVPEDRQHEIKIDKLRTKAGSEAYPTGGIFGVYAYHVDAPTGTNRVQEWNVASSTSYLENVAFKYNGSMATGWNFTTGSASPYYWPLSGSLVFAGYSPHIQASSSTISSVSFVDNLTSGRPENPHLIISFKQNANPDDMVELLYFTMMSTTVDNSSGPVEMAFSKAVSKVTVSFKDPNGYYNIRNVKLKGCIDKGNFYASVESPGWNPDLGSLADYDILTVKTQLSSVPVECSSLLPLPQFLDGYYPSLGKGTGKGVSIAFEVVDKTDDHFYTELEYKLYPYDDGNGNMMNSGLPSRWQPGKHYSYVFTIESDPIEFDNPSVTIMAYEIDNPDII